MQFKDLLYSLSASVAAGRQMSEALIEAYDNLRVLYDEADLIMVELGHMRRSMLNNKESDKVLLQDFAYRSRSEDISNFVQVYVTCRNMGGNLEKIIGHSCQILTDKMNIEKEIRVITKQKQVEGRIIALMPLVMLLIMNITSNSYIEPLYSSVMGRVIMTGSLIAMGAGIYLMEKISAIDI
ncbi:MAG: type II secretion system F family protein [Eubacterium sp.]|nr:type II secretion system F family protein [Candidatus Colimonas fimequi]